MKITSTLIALALASSAFAAPSLEPRTWNDKHQSQSKPIGKHVKEPKYFTSAFSTRAVNTTIINNNQESVPGQPGAFGHFSFKINSDKEIICWDIRTVGVTGEYQSPAFTATHIHQADVGRSGPPRIAFTNPKYERNDITGAEIRTSKGCLQGPFATNVTANGQDTGSASGFKLKNIEENPSNFFSDTHTQAFSAGAIRGQLLRSEIEVKKPRSFTSVLRTEATSDQIITNAGAPTPGLEGASGKYELRINTNEDVICYDITLKNFPKDEKYFSPAKTSTHTHAAPFGSAGPPRLAYKNPERKSYLWGAIKSKTRHSSACIKGPFTTGLLGTDGKDTGSASGFTLTQLQDNPQAYFSDVHTESRQAGAVRGQLYRA
ncbi:hypothetical protein L7F22_039384 [Adiantum nelumboides]|nr:hypothetical protein [Adiantum nelumboides]